MKLKLPRSGDHRAGFALSLILHAALLALVVIKGDQLWSAPVLPGQPALGHQEGAAGGSGDYRVAYITLPSSSPEPRQVAPKRRPPRVPLPRPVVVPSKAEDVAPVEADPVHAVAQPVDSPATPLNATTPGESQSAIAEGQEGPPGGGPGRGTGVGSGEGPNRDFAGGRGTARPPEPRDMAFPFDNPPKELRGMSLNVTFWVRVDGRVQRYTVEPEIKDRDYAKKFDEVMRAFRFAPARAASGRAVAGRATITITLPGKHPS